MAANVEEYKESIGKAIAHYAMHVLGVQDMEALTRATTPLYEVLLDMRRSVMFERIERERKQQAEKLPSGVESAKDDKKMQVSTLPPASIAPFVEVRSQRDSDCGVVALANIAQMDYKKARVEAFQHGWSSTKGIVQGFVELMLAKRGWDASFRPDLRGMSVRQLADSMPSGVFLVYCHGHIMPAANGKLFNWTQASHLTVTEVTELHRRNRVVNGK